MKRCRERFLWDMGGGGWLGCIGVRAGIGLGGNMIGIHPVSSPVGGLLGSAGGWSSRLSSHYCFDV